MKSKIPPRPLVIGLDIGIASVGWCVLASDHIIQLGVRAFDKAETTDKGESLNLIRRSARLMRRRLRRRAWRMVKLARLLRRFGLIGSVDDIRTGRTVGPSSWMLRVEAMDRLLLPNEWARVLYHICRHRGFYWASRAEEKLAAADTKGDLGKVKAGLASTERLMKEHGYRTAAEMIVSEFPTSQRNKAGDYGKSLSRVLLGTELALLFARQRSLGNPHAGPDLEVAILGNGKPGTGLFWSQKPALAGEDLLRMLGKCTLERNEFRAPKASFTAERQVWLTRLNNLRLVIDGETRPLTRPERQHVLSLPYRYASDLSYKQLRAALLEGGLSSETFFFAGLPYPTKAQAASGTAKDPESSKVVRMPSWQLLRSTMKKAGLESEWAVITTDALDGRPQRFDQIAWVLSVYKEDAEVRRELARLEPALSGAMIDALVEIRFDRFHSLSLKALYNIVPFMEQGLRYDEACARAGYHHSQQVSAHRVKRRLLPPLYSGRDKNGRMCFSDTLDIPRNPVVVRALNQARKVVNALIREYGSPSEVHIEMARDLSRNHDERHKVQKAQEEFRDRNERDKADFAAQFSLIGSPKGVDFEKWRLYREQSGKCAYSLHPIDLNRLLEAGYVEVDHALPYSRSFDDSKNNKVLAFTSENRNKGNRTPFEYLGGAESGDRWRAFVAFVESNKSYRLAKRQRLLRREFGERAATEFGDRNLNDTRYICRFFKNYVEQNLQLANDSDAKRCVVLSGQLTAFLRARWGLLKVRGESDRHHALDAFVVAACSHATVKRLSDYARRKELHHVSRGFADPQTGEIVDPAMHREMGERFPDPWPSFRQEVLARLRIDDPDELRIELAKLGTYGNDELANVRPLFVSRAPQRRNGGAAHKETIYGRRASLEKSSGVTERVPLTSLSLSDVDKLIDPQRNGKLYSAIRARLEAFGGKGEKAFGPANPLRKPGKDGSPTGPVVTHATMIIDRLSGIPVRGGVARNDTMLRIDIFSRAGKYFVVPVYVYHLVTADLPNRAIVAHQDESKWTLIDDSFSWCFSVYPNDLLRIQLKDVTHLGYYSQCDRSGGTISIWAQDRDRRVGSEGLVRGIGIKTALSIEKYDVDVLGRLRPAAKERRRGLA